MKWRVRWEISICEKACKLLQFPISPEIPGVSTVFPYSLRKEQRLHPEIYHPNTVILDKYTVSLISDRLTTHMLQAKQGQQFLQLEMKVVSQTKTDAARTK